MKVKDYISDYGVLGVLFAVRYLCYVKYLRPPGVKNYTYFSLVDKRLYSYHQSLLARGPGARINLENIVDPVNSPSEYRDRQTGRDYCQNGRNILYIIQYQYTQSPLLQNCPPSYTKCTLYLQ